MNPTKLLHSRGATLRAALLVTGLALAMRGGFLIPDTAAQEIIPRWPRIVFPPQREPGEPMQLVEMEVRARIVGLQVEATTTMTFRNPNRRILEGELVFPLPDGAVITGYALDVNGRLVDGVIVKKEKARVAFETEVRRGVDPGLVEQVAGNVYRTRIYPLPPQGSRRIRLRYVAELPSDPNGDAAWHFPLPLGETVGKLALRVEVVRGAVTPKAGGFGNLRFQSLENLWVAQTEIQDAKPGEDLWVALPQMPPQVSAVERAADGDVYFAVSDLPASGAITKTPEPPRKIGIAWDASGSRAGDHIQKELATLDELLGLWKGSEVTLLVFRDQVEEPRNFRGDSRALITALCEVTYDGGTDLAVTAEAMKAVPDVDQWLLFSDSFDTLSDKLPDFAKRKVTAVVSQTVAHRELLRQVCADSGGQVVDLQRLDPIAAAQAIANPAPRLTAIHGTGISDVQGVGASALGRVSVRGKLIDDEAELRLEYGDGRQSPPVRLSKKSAPDGVLLASAWAAERITQLAVRPEANEEELLALGRRYGIVSPVTSLIVLETLDQYVRHEIQPPASEPELRRQWEERIEFTAKGEQQSRATKLDRLLAMWKARVDWWEKTYQVPLGFTWKEPAGQPGLGAAAGAAPVEMDGFVNSPAAPAPASRPAMPSSDAFAESAPFATAPRMGAPLVKAETATAAGLPAKAASGIEGAPSAIITVKPWDPATPYLAALKTAAKKDRYKAYLEQRKTYAASPAFFVDCADFFLREGDAPHGVRVLTNLAELKLEEASLLRVLAWRLLQAGEFDRAIVVLRKVVKLRPEEPQSLRDLALALAERGKARRDASNLTEAMALFEKLILGEWQRFEEIEITALEELNALIAWTKHQDWAASARIPALDARLLKNLDVDVRIVMSWDADNTDVDLHVLEPTGEEAFYGHNLTTSGGLVSRDFTEGYGPEEYLVRRAQPGPFRIFAHYYGSQQQNVLGAATVTATVFTDFGRPAEKKQVLTLRLDKPREKADIGEITFGGKGAQVKEGQREASGQPKGREAFRALRAGQTQEQVIRLVGEPQEKPSSPDAKAGEETWLYRLGGRQYRLKFSAQKGLLSVVELLPGGAEMILVQ